MTDRRKGLDSIRMRLWAVSVLSLTLPHPSLAAVNAETNSRSFGLVVAAFRWAHNPGKDDCPAGLTDTRTENFLKSLPAGQAALLRKPENEPELVFRSAILPSGLDTGSSPAEALARREGYPGFRPVRAMRSWGLDLDGDRGKGGVKGVRPHPNFTGMDGEPGIDNELYRAFGCTKFYRWSAEAGESISDPFDTADLSGRDNNAIKDGAMTILIEVNGADDRRNDPEVEVRILSGRNPMAKDAQGRPAPFSSQTADPNPAWHNRARGRIVDGILETEPFDLRLKFREAACQTETVMRAARLRLTLLPDGGAKGLLAGYSDLDAIYWPLPGTYRLAYEGGANHDGPAEYRTLHEYADAYPDPETGRYTAISSARAIVALPAFIFHEQSEESVRLSGALRRFAR